MESERENTSRDIREALDRLSVRLCLSAVSGKRPNVGEKLEPGVLLGVDAPGLLLGV